MPVNIIGLMKSSKDLQRKVNIITPLGKRYSGFIDVPNASLRTTDIFNSSSAYWKDQKEKYFDDGLLLHEVKIFLTDSPYKKYDTLQIKLSRVIAFYDEFSSIGSETERSRFETLNKKTGSQIHTVHIITKITGNSFYEINGLFSGLLKKTAHDRFIPLTQVEITEVINKDSKWFRKAISIPSHFLGVSTSFIEAMKVKPAI